MRFAAICAVVAIDAPEKENGQARRPALLRSSIACEHRVFWGSGRQVIEAAGTIKWEGLRIADCNRPIGPAMARTEILPNRSFRPVRPTHSQTAEIGREHLRPQAI